MKKIVSLMIMIACLLTLFACGESAADPIAAVKKMYSVSCPTKIESQTVQTISGRDYVSTETVVCGKVDGKDASVYESTYDDLADIMENAALPIVPRKSRVEYLEGKGTRENNGAWDAEGKNFAPTNGSIAINLTKDTATDAALSEDGKVFTCTVKAADTAAVFGEGNGIASDVSVTITTNGSVVTCVELAWQVVKTLSTPAVDVAVKTIYSYDLEVITLSK